MDDKKANLQPPKYTASCSLFILTFIAFVLICVVYFSWYMDEFIILVKKDTQISTITVRSSDELIRTLQDVQAHTILILEPGVYKGNFRLVNKSNVTIRAEKGPVTMHALAETAFIIQDCTQCKLENIGIKTDDAKMPALVLTKVQNFTGSLLVIQAASISCQINAKSSEITLKSSQLNGVLLVEESSRISLVENGISADASSGTIKMGDVCQILLEKNEIQGSHCIAFHSVSAEKNLENCLLGNKITATTGNAISMEQSSHISLTSNTIESVKQSISILKCQHIQIGKIGVKNKAKSTEGNTLDISGSKGIVVMDNWFINQNPDLNSVLINACSDVRVCKNEISGFAEYKEGILHNLQGGGMAIQNSTDVQVISNQIYNALLSGIRVEKESNGISLSENAIQNNWGNGIDVEESEVTIGPSNTITKNRIGISLRNGKGIIQENKVTENKNEGIFLERSSPKIVKNEIAKNENSGLSLKGQSLPELEGNRFIENQGFGIFFGKPVSIAWKEQNIFEKNVRGISDQAK